jgi:putative membrane-bound dehydrogenase-like protein
MADALLPQDDGQHAPADRPENLSAETAPKIHALTSKRRRPILVAGILLGLCGCFLVGRRIYYRLIQPEPPWEQSTSKNEVVVADSSMQVTLWADESLILNPTSISVDRKGRLWVTEAVNYRNWNHQAGAGERTLHEAGDRIVILEDSDGDGRADKSTVFAQEKELIAPTGICVLGNRVFVSCSPNIFVFYDDDGDDRADRREIFLTGFGGKDHDHGVHSLVPGPDGRLYFTVGNAGPHVVSDKNGWTLRAGSQYQPVTGDGQSESASGPSPKSAPRTLNTGGLVSDDGKVYVGGLALSIKPDGTDLRVHSHNSRNPYELCVDSCGNIWQLDNDDTASCRMTWLMNGSNQGFASADGQRTWQSDQRPGQETSQAHWHQSDPGVLPAGEIYGTGAPTGMVRYEGDLFGEPFRGTILACDAGLGCVFGFRPIPSGAGFRFERTKLVWSEPADDDRTGREDGLASTWFRPVDSAIAPDGSVFVADWYDSYVGAHRANDLNAAGRIYRVTPRRPQKTPPDQKTTGDSGEDLATLLKSPAPEIRAFARERLLQNSKSALPIAASLLANENPFIRARAQWLIQDLSVRNDEAQELLQSSLDSSSDQTRVTSLRGLLELGVSPAELSPLLFEEESAAVRREFALALRGRPLDEIREPLIQLAARLNENDPWEVEAFGLACEGHETAIYEELRLRFGEQPADWSSRFSVIAWRLHPVSALADFEQRLQSKELSVSELQRTLDAIGFAGGQVALKIIDRFVKLIATDSDAARRGLRDYAEWWSRRLKEQSDNSKPGDGSQLPPLPVRFQSTESVKVDSSRIQAITKLAGDAARGESLFFSEKVACGKCHRFSERGGRVGPDLTFISRRFDRSALAISILYPSAAILTGYESWTVLDQRGRTHTGLLVSAGSEIVLNSADGKTIRILRGDIDELIRQGQSLMPDSPATSLQPQQIADLLSFLATRK